MAKEISLVTADAVDLDHDNILTDNRRAEKGTDTVGNIPTMTSGPTLIEGSKKTMANAQELAARWNAKQKKFGKTEFRCPFCKVTDPLYKTAKKCEAHMAKAHKAKLQLAKQLKTPKADLTPRPVLISPPRTVEDLMTPQQAKIARTIQDMRAAANNGHGSHQVISRMTAAAIMGMPEMLGCNRIKELNDREVVELARMASARGRRLVARKAKQVMTERHLSGLSISA